MANQQEVTAGFTEINEKVFGNESPRFTPGESSVSIRGHSEANPQAAVGLHEVLAK